jgi:hypothetical protein
MGQGRKTFCRQLPVNKEGTRFVSRILIFQWKLYAYVSIRCERTTSSSSAFSPSLPFFSEETGSSFDVLIARFASSPMGTASSAYGSISSTRVFGESGESSEPDDARRGCACCCCCCFRSSSDSSESPVLSSWKGFLARPDRTGGDRTEDWSRSSHAITVCRWWSLEGVAMRYASIERGVARYGLCNWKKRVRIAFQI